jgi:hypothetical protein
MSNQVKLSTVINNDLERTAKNICNSYGGSCQFTLNTLRLPLHIGTTMNKLKKIKGWEESYGGGWSTNYQNKRMQRMQGRPTGCRFAGTANRPGHRILPTN